MATLFDKLQEHGREQGSRVAVWQRQLMGTYVPTTFGELASEAQRFANAFSAELPRGQIVPMLLAKTSGCIAAMIGALGAGRAFSCLFQKLRPPQIEHILEVTQAPVALVDGPGLQALKDGILPNSVIAKTRWWLLRGPDFGPLHDRLAQQLKATAPVEEWPTHAAPAQTAPAAIDAKTVGCCLFTSGSTGTPKGVLIGQADLLARAEAEVLWFGLRREDILLNILPFSFDVGLNQLLTFVNVGCELVLCDSWFPKDIMKTVEVRKVTGISAVPSIWLDFMTKGQRFDRHGPHSTLRYITVSGGDMSRAHLDQLPVISDQAQIFKTYGQTEAFRASSLKPHEFAARPTSVGRPFQGVQIYIVREDGSRAAPNEPGEVVHTGLGVMLGYLGGRDQQSKLRTNPFHGSEDPNELAIFTGDQGYLDDKGYLFLSGRRDDMVKITGNRVYPLEVRDQMLTIDGIGVAEVVPFKMDDETKLAGCVILKTGSKLDARAIQAEMARRVPSYMVPEVILIKTEFPKTASLKPDRPLLAAEARQLLQSSKPANS